MTYDYYHDFLTFQTKDAYKGGFIATRSYKVTVDA